MPNDAMTRSLHTITFDATTPADEGKRVISKMWYGSPDGAFKTGFWAAQPGKSDIHYTKDELCTLLEGKVRLTATDGTVATYSAGDTFLIPNGFKGTWETIEPVRKFYAIYQKT